MNFGKRLASSVLLNTVRSIIIFITGMTLAKGLGPEQYGLFSFLLASFAAIITLFDMGSSSAFFSFISKRTRSKSFFMVYFGWVIFQFLTAIILIRLVIPADWLALIWQGESRELVLLAFVGVFFQNQIWTLVVKVGESQRLTTIAQMLGVAIALIHFLLIIVLYYQGLLSLSYVYFLIIAEILVGAIIAKLIFPLEFNDEKINLRGNFSEYWIFCKPLVPYVWLSVIMSFADTWLLRHFGGGVEQGYYAVAAQMGTVTLLFTSSIVRVLWKEVAEANEQKDIRRVAFVYKKVSRIVFMAGVVISGYLIPWTDEIITLLLGNEYLEGATVMWIMLLYPIHQSLGQINGTMYFALELTKPYVVINSIHLIISIGAVYFLLAPAEAHVSGLGLGAIGLALKMVVIQIITVNVSIWWLCQYQGWRFDYEYQAFGIFLFVLLGICTYIGVNALLDDSVYLLIRFGLSSTLYLLAAVVIFIKMPWLLGLTDSELKAYISKFKALRSSL